MTTKCCHVPIGYCKSINVNVNVFQLVLVIKCLKKGILNKIFLQDTVLEVDISCILHLALKPWTLVNNLKRYRNYTYVLKYNYFLKYYKTERFRTI